MKRTSEFWRFIWVENDLYTLSQFVARDLCENFSADLCSIYYTNGQNVLSRLGLFHSALEEKGEEIDTRFSHVNLPLNGSLAGYVIRTNKSLVFRSTEGFTIEDYLISNGLEEEVYSDSLYNVKVQFEQLNQTDIRNCIIIPLKSIKNESDSLPWMNIQLSITLLNVGYEDTTIEEFEALVKKIKESIQSLGPIVFSSISFDYLKEENEINQKVKELEYGNTYLEDVINQVQDDFTKRLGAKLSHFWYYDQEHNLFNLNSIKAYADKGKKYDGKKSKEILRIIDNQEIRVLSGNQCLIGKLAKEQMTFLKRYQLNGVLNEDWKKVLLEFDCTNLIAFPLFTENFFGVLCFHLDNRQVDLEKLSMSYYLSYLQQASIVFKYKLSKRFEISSIEMNRKILKLTRKNPDIIYKEILYKLKDLIGCEICSLFTVKKSKIYFTATTDKSEKSKKRIGKIVGEVGEGSIIGYCSKYFQMLNIFSVNNVSDFYPKINANKERVFIEGESLTEHKTMLLVPFRNGNDDNWFVIKAINKINNKASNPIKINNFLRSDADLINYTGSIFQNYKHIFDGNNDRNRLLGLLLHEVESPIKVLKNKARKIELSVTDILNRLNNPLDSEDIPSVSEILQHNTLVKNVIHDVYRNLDVLRSWTHNIETINTLFLGNQVMASKREIHLYKVLKDLIFWKQSALKRSQRNISSIDINGVSQDLMIICDERHSYQILGNVLDNAIKYSSFTDNASIKIHTNIRGDYVDVFIEDYGIGIEEVDGNRIFLLEYRSEVARKLNYAGEGYGLWLTKKLIDANRGKIEVMHFKKPTVFKITLMKSIKKYDTNL
jgi:signal transduction histidine kinase